MGEPGRRRFAGLTRPAPPSVASHLVPLDDGRTVAVQEYGTRSGPPVFYFHGWPACRLEAGLIPGMPVRLLAMDRPGYGQSSPKPGRTLLDLPTDVALIATKLGIERFHVIGLSGGAPFATACAAALGARVRGLALVSPVPPAQHVPGRAKGVVQLYRMAGRPQMTRHFFGLVRTLVRRRLVSPRTVMGGQLNAADHGVLTPERMRQLARVWQEALGRGIEGALADAVIYGQPWGLALDAIDVPTSLWCGGQDGLVPLGLLDPYRAIPGIRWHMLPEEGHFSLALRQADRVLAELLA